MGFHLSRIWSVRFRPDGQSRYTNHPQTPVGASAAREALALALALAPQPSIIGTTAALIINPTVRPEPVEGDWLSL